MKKVTLIISILILTSFQSMAQISDTQVIEYVKQATAAGKSQAQIGVELSARGVTRAQVQRIKNRYDAQKGKFNLKEETYIDRYEARSESMPSESTPSEQDLVELPFEEEKQSRIFGQDLFLARLLSFEPNDNIATPDDYKLGPGDEILIDIWGANELSMAQTISPEGRIYVSQVGPIQLNGLSISAASAKIKKILSAKYSGLDDNESSVSVTLGRARTIKVNVMGEVSVPGTYSLSSFATVFHAIYKAGGIRESGSLRAIKLMRSGKLFAEVDVYDYLLRGDNSCDINLRDDDVILVPSYLSHIDITGGVKRSLIYELKEGESLQDLIDYAGGFSSDAYSGEILVTRNNDTQKEVNTVSKEQFAGFLLRDGDLVEVSAVMDRYTNRVSVGGAVFRPGYYQIGEDVVSLKQLIHKAGGPLEDAFLDRVLITREKNNLDQELIAVNLASVLSGAASDVLLKKNDIVQILRISQIEDRGTLTINGMVAKPGTYKFVDNTSIEDLIVQAGGLLEGASTVRIDIARRILDSKSMESSDILGMTYSFPINDGFAIEGAESFILEPYDVVSVRLSPGYRRQTFVEVSGALTFPGEYVLLSRNERVSDLVYRSGGLTSQAYAKGARLIRHAEKEDTLYSNVREKNPQKDTADASNLRLSDVIEKNSRKDTVDVSNLRLSESYMVAIDLEKALANPGSDYDVVLKEGDKLVVPDYDNTVRVLGEVMFPNAISYVEGKKLSYYINSAGGYTEQAKKSKAYIMYANGSAAKYSACGSPIEPGCIIVVPTRAQVQRMTPAEITSMATATTSLSYVMTMLVNLFLK